MPVARQIATMVSGMSRAITQLIFFVASAAMCGKLERVTNLLGDARARRVAGVVNLSTIKEHKLPIAHKQGMCFA